MKLLTICNLFC